MPEKVVIKVTKGLKVKVTHSTHDWEVRDKDSDKTIEQGKKS